ncbi:hypothetical protein BU14_0528s0012 [Porphyra umbilicalis]|uniref:Uncharacterized protein n=1 Tax=Porphyra umbilicalis TaxID=2786 RepID=A0A1X6NS95_PORUM|nr:hypothetical protein BU14_0528s0012 [Porphyra umbilicalis]|eukprot:OSX71484.1 hypothetical protein BU14_0528s0012 [Porphyra umbilicalis]
MADAGAPVPSAPPPADGSSDASAADNGAIKKSPSMLSRYSTRSTAAAFNHGLSRRRTEAAGLFTLWSAFVLIEGLIRFVRSDATRDLLPDGRPSDVIPPLLPFLGGLFEVIFGFTGLVVGIIELAFASGGIFATICFLIIQVPLSWFTFIVYVFMIPAYRWRLDLVTVVAGTTLSVSRTHGLIAMGVVTSVAFCAALQGGQFVFALRLLAYQAQQAQERPSAALTTALTHARPRAIFWCALFTLGGASTLAAGAVLADALGSGRVDAPAFYAFPPHVGVYPVMTAVTGGVMTVYGLASVAAAAGVGALVGPTVHALPLVFALMFVNFALVQVASIGSPAAEVANLPGRLAFAAAMHTGLTLVSVVIGPYFVVRVGKEADPGGAPPVVAAA